MSSPLAAMLARKLSHLNFAGLGAAGDRLRDIAGRINLPSVNDLRYSPEIEALERGLGPVVRGAKAAVWDPGMNILSTALPGTEQHAAMRDDIWDMPWVRSLAQAVVNPQDRDYRTEPPVRDRGPEPPAPPRRATTAHDIPSIGTRMAQDLIPKEIPIGGGLPRIEEIPVRPMMWGREDELPPTPRMPSDEPNPLAMLFDNERDYGAEYGDQRNRDLAQMLLNFGAGMGSAPLGDLVGGMARGAAGWSDAYGKTLSKRDWIAAEKDKDLARLSARMGVAEQMQDLTTPDAERQTRQFLLEQIKELPREQWGEALFHLQTGDEEALGKMFGYGEYDAFNLSGSRVLRRPGQDGIEEHLFPGSSTWISTADPNYEKVRDQAVKASPGFKTTAASRNFTASQKSDGDNMSWLTGEDQSQDDLSFEDFYSPEAKEGIAAYRSMSDSEKQAQIEALLGNPQWVDAFTQDKGRAPTPQDVDMTLAGMYEGIQ